MRHAAVGGQRPGPAPAATRPAPATPHDKFPRRQQQDAGRPDVLSNNLPLHRVMQQRCHHASAPARIPSWPPMPRPRPQRAAAVRPERIQPRIRNRIFYKHTQGCVWIEMGAGSPARW